MAKTKQARETQAALISVVCKLAVKDPGAFAKHIAAQVANKNKFKPIKVIKKGK